MRNGNKEVKGKLYGIGIGPGDPKLLTLRAKEILDEVNTIFVPKAPGDSPSYARSIIEEATLEVKKIIELAFPMTKDKKALKAHWQQAAQVIAQEIAKSKKAVFATIGDPFIYSTYIYLARTLQQNFPQVELETIPGVSAFGAAAARAQFPLVAGKEKLAVLPVSENLVGLKKAFQEFDTVVLMKVGSKLPKVIRLLKKMKLIKDSVLISRLGQAQERIIRDLSSLRDKSLGYLSVMIVKSKNRD